MPPGMEPSADPVLQSRLFSYPDAHRHRVGVNYQQLPVNQTRTSYHHGNFERDGGMAFYNQGSRPNYLSSIDPIQFRERTVDLDKVHGQFINDKVTFLSTIKPEDFEAPRTLWEKVFDEGAKERFIGNISGHMANCTKEEIIKRQIGIFREVSDDLATRLEKATGIKSSYRVADMSFNGTHNGMPKVSAKNKMANHMTATASPSSTLYNGAPVKNTHGAESTTNGHTNGHTNGTNGVKGH